MTGTRSYSSAVRDAATDVTRRRILDVATEAFTSRWYDEVTLRGVAAEAGVALQTVSNHFASKELLFAAAIDEWGDRIASSRFAVDPGDVAAALQVLVEDYERTGETTLRLLALEDRVPAVRPPLTRGRQGHEDWVERVFPDALRGLRGGARRRRRAQLVVVTDVYTWRLLRRDKGFSPQETCRAMTELVLALHG